MGLLQLNSGAKKGEGRAQEKLRYVRGDSLLHRLDPRTKILLLIAFTSAALLTVDTGLTLVIFTALIALALLSGAFRHWSSMLGTAAPLVLIIVVFDSLFSHVSAGPVMLAANFWILHATVTPGSLVYAVTIGLRFLSLLGMSALFIMITRFEDFVSGLRKLGMPYTIAFCLGLALRSVTLLAADLRAILDAQRSRGLEFDAGLLRSVERLLPLAMPAIVCLINRSRNVSSAMLCRGYRHGGRPTTYSRLKMRYPDWIVITCIMAGAMAYIYLCWLKI